MIPGVLRFLDSLVRSLFFSLFLFLFKSASKSSNLSYTDTSGAELSVCIMQMPMTRGSFLKVAEHSFSARSCWCNLAREQGFQKTNIPSTERSFYLLKTRTLCYFSL